MKLMVWVALEVSLAVLPSLWTSAHCECRRAGGTDCATANGECSILYDKDTDTIISLIGWPPENNRTCHRTCFEDDVCKTHFRNEKEIEIESHDPAQYTVRRIFSPRFGAAAYRTATNCRFNIQCGEGQVLSYSVDDFELQEKISCSSDNPVCVDWVDHHIGNIAQSHKVCGSGEAGEVHSDGADSMLVEFVANRDSVLLKGFQYTVTCIVPEFDNNAVRLGAVPATAAQRRAAGRCTSPDGRQRRQIYHSPPPTVRPTVRPSVVSLTLEMSHYLSFGYLTITVHRGEFGIASRRAVYLTVVNRFSRKTYPLWRPLNREIKGYGYLWISGSRAYLYQTGAHPVFNPSREETAVIHRLEAALNRALGDAEQYDVVDELDNIPTPRPTPRPGYDGVPGPRPTMRPHTPGVPGVADPPTEPGTLSPPTLRPSRPPGPPGLPVTRPTGPPGPPGPPGLPLSRPPGQRGRRAVIAPPRLTAQQGTLPPTTRPTGEPTSDDQLALRYGNACNGVLRAVACAYQHVVLQRNCN